MTEKTSILQKDPLLLLLLGAYPALAATADVRAALGMGIMVLAVLLLSGIIAFTLRGRLSQGAGFATCAIIVAGCASVAQMLSAAFLPAFYSQLGIYAGIVAVIALTNRFAHEVKEAESMGQAVKTALTVGLYLLVVMVIVAAVREVLGSASIAGVSLDFFESYKISALGKAPGAYIVLAMAAAVVAACGSKKEKEGK